MNSKDAHAASTGPPPDIRLPVPPAAGALRRSDQLFIGVLAAASVILGVAYWLRLSHWGIQEVEIDRLPPLEFAYQIDLNSANWVELTQLEGIGPTLAHRIVADRETNGPFAAVDELQRVKGIGPRTVARVRDKVKPISNTLAE